MSGRLVFLLEEESMKQALRFLIPKIFPTWQEEVNWVPIVHRGKSDLEKSIPRKLKAWTEPSAKFVIIRDNDGGDCIETKKRLKALSHVQPDRSILIRIVCQELESWFLGDLEAVSQATPEVGDKIRAQSRRAKFRKPDRLTNASDELGKLVRMRGKVSRAKKIAPHMTISKNVSHSFQAFVSGLERFVQVK